MDVTKYLGSSSTLNVKSVKDGMLEGKQLTINGIESRSYDDRDKLVLGFDEIELSLVLNVTNGSIISEAFGKESDAWKGKKISLGIIKTKMGSEMKDGIQVRIEK